MGSPAYYTQYGGTQPERVGAQHPTVAPYGPFDTADGETVLLAVQNEREWESFCDTVLGDPALAGDERFARNSARVAHREELNAIIAERLRTLDTATALGLLDRAAVANSRLNSVAGFLTHPVLTERDRWRKVGSPGGEIQALLPPANLGGVEPRMDPVPSVGEHTDAILRGLGHTDAEIERLRAEGVV
jgi:formyl-CoA transferase